MTPGVCLTDGLSAVESVPGPDDNAGPGSGRRRRSQPA